ncbi:hypothetical protein OF83DRAFT_32535 [Amylostereum chailletii]|nr:hypothetical protein OF83DRAFT_32535 [Amylostereum chailletii]
MYTTSSVAELFLKNLEAQKDTTSTNLCGSESHGATNGAFFFIHTSWGLSRTLSLSVCQDVLEKVDEMNDVVYAVQCQQSTFSDTINTDLDMEREKIKEVSSDLESNWKLTNDLITQVDELASRMDQVHCPAEIAQNGNMALRNPWKRSEDSSTCFSIG